MNALNQIAMQGFGSIKSSEFDAALAKFKSLLASGDPGAKNTAFEAIVALDRSESLPSTEKNRRAGVILGTMTLNDVAMRELATLASTLGSPCKNAITRYLPADLKKLVYVPATIEAAAPTVDVEQNRSAAIIAPNTRDTQDSELRPVVLLFGTTQEHQHNLQLLKRHAISCVRAKTLREFDDMLSDDVVGIVVGRSVWLQVADHEQFLSRICRFSSLTYLKIDSSGFAKPTEFDRLCAIARMRGQENSQVLRSDSCNIVEADVPRLKTIVAALNCNANVRLYPRDIPPSISRVLIAGVEQHINERYFPGRIELREIGTKTIHDGRSSAMIVLAHPQDLGPPLIIKIDSFERLADEMNRFNQFIRPWDQVLQPQIHFHGEKSVIVFGLVDTPDSVNSPAPTFDEEIRKCFNVDTGSPILAPSVESIELVIDRTIKKLSELNSRPCTTSRFESYAWMGLETVFETERRGFRWSFSGFNGNKQPVEQAHDAASCLADYRTLATVHGDMHLKNVLVRDTREPYLIDYAYSGPGHPCFDLVRFYLSITFRFFRMLSGEDRLCSVFATIFDESRSLDSIKSEFAPELASPANGISLYAAIKCRQVCIQLCDQYGLPHDHFRKLTLVMACQSLCLLDLQVGIARAMAAAASVRD